MNAFSRINKSLIVKIADFGLSRDIYRSDYYRVEDKKRPLPVKWMAIESLTEGVFSSKTDVVSLFFVQNSVIIQLQRKIYMLSFLNEKKMLSTHFTLSDSAMSFLMYIFQNFPVFLTSFFIVVIRYSSVGADDPRVQSLPRHRHLPHQGLSQQSTSPPPTRTRTRSCVSTIAFAFFQGIHK